MSARTAKTIPLPTSKATANSPSQFDRWWNSIGEWVEPANHRRGGESGVVLIRSHSVDRPDVYCKRQTGHIYRTLCHPLGLPTVLRERLAYGAFARLGIRTPKIVYCGVRHVDGSWRALLATEALQGFVSLDHWYAQKHTQQLNQAVMQVLAKILVRLHMGGWQHGCLYPKHIFVRAIDSSYETPQIEIALLDLEKSRRRWSFSKTSRRDLSQLERHRGDMPIEDVQLLLQTYRATINGGGI